MKFFDKSHQTNYKQLYENIDTKCDEKNISCNIIKIEYDINTYVKIHKYKCNTHNKIYKTLIKGL